MEVLDRRRLNRATLARQMLLDRVATEPRDVVGRLVGLQAQDPDLPYVGLWCRVAGFAHDDLTTALERRDVVRATLWRGTQHLLTADDYLWMRPLLQPMLDRWQRTAFGRQCGGADPGELASAAAALLGDGTLDRPTLGRALRDRWPDGDPTALARSVQGLLPVVHPPPDGTWGRRGRTPFTLATAWLGRAPAAGPEALGELVLRYLAAFGPATAADATAWSGITRLRPVVEALRPRLRVFVDDRGRELFDLPDAPRPDPDVPAPARFLPVLDNVVVGYADRSRIVADAHRTDLVVEPALTVDGFVRGVWRIDGGTLAVRLFAPLSAAEEAEVTAEGAALLRFAAADTGPHDVRLTVA